MRRKWRKKGGRPTPAIRRDDAEEYVTPGGGLPIAPAYVSTISRPDEKTFVGQSRRPISSAQTRFVGTLSYRRMRLMVGTAGDFWWPPSALCTAGYVRDRTCRGPGLQSAGYGSLRAFARCTPCTSCESHTLAAVSRQLPFHSA